MSGYGPGPNTGATTIPYDGSELVSTGVSIIDVIGGSFVLLVAGLALWYVGTRIKNWNDNRKAVDNE